MSAPRARARSSSAARAGALAPAARRSRLTGPTPRTPTAARGALPLLPLLSFVAFTGPLAPAAAQDGLPDYEHVGRLEDARHQPSALSVGPHSFEPSITYRLFGVSTPHVYGAGALGWTDNLLRSDHRAPGVRLRREPFGRGTAGLRLDTELGEHRLEFDYRATATEYFDTGRFDTFEQRAATRLDLYWTDLEAHADASWTRSAYPQSIQLRGLVRLDTYAGRGWLEARVGRYGVQVGANARRLDFLQRELEHLDHRTYGADLQVYGRIRPRLRALVEYNWGVVQYDEGRRAGLNDYQLHQLRAGLDGTLTAKLSASLKLGAGLQDVDRRAGGERDAFAGFLAETSLRWEALARTTLLLAYARRLTPSISSNYLEADEVRLEVRQLLFDDKVTAAVRGRYVHARISSGGRIERAGATASLTYKLRQWLSVVAEYGFDRLWSPSPSPGYRVHTVTLSLGVGL